MSIYQGDLYAMLSDARGPGPLTGETIGEMLTEIEDPAHHAFQSVELAGALLQRDNLPPETVDKVAATLSNWDDNTSAWFSPLMHARAELLLYPGRNTHSQIDAACAADINLAKACTAATHADADFLRRLAKNTDSHTTLLMLENEHCPGDIALPAIAKLNDADAVSNNTTLLRLALRTPAARRHASTLVMTLRPTAALPILFDADLTVEARRHAIAEWLPGSARTLHSLRASIQQTLQLLGAEDDDAEQVETDAATVWRGEMWNQCLTTPSPDLRGNPQLSPERLATPSPAVKLAKRIGHRLMTLPTEATARGFWETAEQLSAETNAPLAEVLQTAAAIVHTRPEP